MIKTLLICAGLAVGSVLMCGCEWTTGNNVETWHNSQTPSWADFSGSYKAPDGGILVRSFGTTVSTNQVVGEQLGAGTGSATEFSGTLAHTPVRGSLNITVGAYRFTDSGSSTTSVGTVSLSVTPADGSAGTLNYSTRAWSLVFPAPIASGSAILAGYYYLGDASQGNHGNAIYSLVIYQTGNRMQIIDNNSSSYNGTMGNIAGTTNGPVVAQFSATGSSQGYKVTIVGAMQAIASGSGALSARTMNGTFVEEGGSEGDIHAVAQ